MIKKNQIKNLLLDYSPFFISLVIFCLILIVHPFDIKKYDVSLKNEFKANKNSFYTYSDLDGDDISEKIRFLCLEGKNLTGIVVYQNNRIVNQWNFKGIINITNVSYLIGDYNNNNYEEIILFTYHNDSIFLNMVEPLGGEKIEINNQFYEQSSRSIINVPDADFSVFDGGFANFTGNSFKELYFSISPGGYKYPPQPRKVCIYDLVKDTLLFSPEAGIQFRALQHVDLNNDNVPEITGNTYAFGNCKDDFPYTDQKGWLMVFNRKLDFIFEPISFDEFPMKLYVEPFSHKGENLLFVYHNYNGVKNITSKLLIYNQYGNIVHEKVVEDLSKPRGSSILNHDGNLYFLKGNGTIQLLDKSLNLKESWNIESIRNGKVRFRGDINGDKKDELIFYGKKDNEFIITQNNLKNPVSVKIPYTNNCCHFAVKKEGEKKIFLFTHTENITATYTYKKNQLYVFRYPLYVGLFGVLWFVVWLIKYFQAKILHQQYERQQKISELQLKSVKNQIEPHFTFNLLNSISSLLYKEDIDKANDIIVKYSKLLRSSLVYSDRIIISLSEEINYIENYLEIEKYRLEDKFTYTIETDPAVNLDVSVPKMFIFTFVENAVKHGIRHLKGSGFIHLIISKTKRNLLVEIKDNGIGRKKAAKLEEGSTKKGIETVDKILNYYKELKNKTISYEMSNLNDNFDENPGTYVKIYIPYGFKKNQ